MALQHAATDFDELPFAVMSHTLPRLMYTEVAMTAQAQHGRQKASMQPALSTGAGAVTCQPQQHSQEELQQHWQQSSRSSTAMSRQRHEQMQWHSSEHAQR